MNEEWKQVPGLPTKWGGYYASRDGKIKNGLGKMLLLRPHYKGYHCIRVVKYGRSTNFQVHRAVAFAWIPNPENKPQINHKNGIKTDNRVENLEWCTNKENYYHAAATGLRNTDKVKSAIARLRVLTDQEVREIRAVHINKNGIGSLTRNDVAKMYNVSFGTIKNIRNKKTYTHI